jgi:TonB family protein
VKLPLACLSIAVLFGQENSVAHYQNGLRLLDQLDLKGAVSEFETASRGSEDPAAPRARSHLKLAEIYTFAGQYADAVEQAEEVRRFGVGHPEEVAKAAAILQQLHMPDQYAVFREGLVTDQRPEPEYSDEARIAGLEGTVGVSAIVREDGIPRDLRVIRPLGLGLDEKALEAAAQWRYTPAQFQDRLVPAPVLLNLEFQLPAKQSRWHLARAAFLPPEGASRPVFLEASYPPGAGISRKSRDEASVIAAIGRVGSATLCFYVDQHGIPVHFRVQAASDTIWANEAIAVVADWRFQPGMKDGFPMQVPALVTLAWGQRDMTLDALASAQFNMEAKDIPDNAPVKVLRSFPPPYTDQAKAAGLEGSVRLAVDILRDGTPVNVRVVKPLGLGLDESAVRTVRSWRFMAAMVNGQPTVTTFTIDVKFSLK